MSSSNSGPFSSFWRNPLAGGLAGALAALLISGLSAFAMRRLGQEMDWLAVLSGGAAGGLAGHFVLRGVLAWLDRSGKARSPMDRFAWMVVSGLVASLVLGVAFFAVIFVGLSASPDGTRVLGSKLFVMIGWLVGVLASSLPLALLELQREDPSRS